MLGASGQRLIERNDHGIGAFGESQQPGVRPQLRRSVILARVLPNKLS
jgi:hypothetical protein